MGAYLVVPMLNRYNEEFVESISMQPPKIAMTGDFNRLFFLITIYSKNLPKQNSCDGIGDDDYQENFLPSEKHLVERKATKQACDDEQHYDYDYYRNRKRQSRKTSY